MYISAILLHMLILIRQFGGVKILSGVIISVLAVWFGEGNTKEVDITLPTCWTIFGISTEVKCVVAWDPEVTATCRGG